MRLTGTHLPQSTWFAIKTVPGKAEAVKGILERDPGVRVAMYPNRWSRWTVRGRKYKRKCAMVTGYVFIKVTQEPLWHVLKQREPILGVLSHGNQPIALPGAIIKSLQGLTVEAEELKKAKAELMRIREGDKAKFTEGPLTGFTIEVTGVSDGLVRFLFPGSKVETKGSVTDMERVV